MTLKAGFARVDITAHGKCDMDGFVARKQPSLGVAMPVSGRVLVMSDGRTRAVVGVCDLLGLSLADSVRVESAMAKAAGVPVRNVLLACTHTHSGPMSMYLGTVGRFDPGYIDFLLKRMARAAAAARRDMAPVTELRIGSGAVPERGHFRCAVNEPGRQKWPGEFTVASLVRRDAPPIVMIHYGVHPYVLGPRNRWIHPDYPGPLCEELARRTGGEALFLPGCGADVEATPAWGKSFAVVKQYARDVAAAAGKALRSARVADCTPLRAAFAAPPVRFGFLPPRVRKEDNAEGALASLARAAGKVERNVMEWQEAFKRGRLPETDPFRMHLVRIGSLIMAGLPAELFHDTGVDLSAAVRGTAMLTVSHAGGDVGYLPRRFAYKHLTYEVTDAFQWYRTAGALVPATEPAVRKVVAAEARKLISA
mgnify:CR=1 FL=1